MSILLCIISRYGYLRVAVSAHLDKSLPAGELKLFYSSDVIRLMSKVYSLKKIQQLPITLSEAWDFFSNPANLANITPANIGFNIISKHHVEKMYAGQIIEYIVKPVLGIPLYWMTEITHVQNKKYFIDEAPWALFFVASSASF